MIFPINHENQEVNRLPWDTFAVILICVTAHILNIRTIPRYPDREALNRFLVNGT